MRRLVIATLLLLTFATAAPAYAKGGGPAPFFPNIGRNFVTGAHFYAETISGWFRSLLGLIGVQQQITVVAKDGACTQKTRCEPGLVCLNVCGDAKCDRMEKRCLSGPAIVSILGETSKCSEADLCADGTECTNVCLPGSDCVNPRRCLKLLATGGGSCEADTDCRGACAKLAPPGIGPAALIARCSSGSCTCHPVLIDPAAARVACPARPASVFICPNGTYQACTMAAATGDQPVETCLTGAEYGGTCLADEECAAAGCPEGAEKFCGEDRTCKCRRVVSQPIPCTTSSQCASAGCAATEIAACVSGACSCAPAGAVSSCQTVSDCSSDCPQGYAAACSNAKCVCQRTKEPTPTVCADVSECGVVSCPTGYDKACLNAVCACTRTVQP